jgi:arsenate reductase
VDCESINYIEHLLPLDDLKKLLQRARLTPYDVLRTKEPAYRELVAGKNLDNEQLLQVMAAHPELLQRPTVTREDKAVLARPFENPVKLGIR